MIDFLAPMLVVTREEGKGEKAEKAEMLRSILVRCEPAREHRPITTLKRFARPDCASSLLLLGAGDNDSHPFNLHHPHSSLFHPASRGALKNPRHSSRRSRCRLASTRNSLLTISDVTCRISRVHSWTWALRGACLTTVSMILQWILLARCLRKGMQ